MTPGGVPASPDPSHVSNFSLKLSELVNQALTPTVAGVQHANTGVVNVTKHATGRSSVPRLDQITYEGKRLPNRAKVHEIALLVTSELRYAAGLDAYLLRAVSRACLKALTLFSNRIDSLLVPAAKDSSILVMPSTAKEGIHISPALEYNIGLATITWIVEDALENCIEGDESPNVTPAGTVGMPAFVSEILTPVKKKMENTILHVIQPVLASVKVSITASILKGIRQPFISAGSPSLTPSVSNDSPLPPLSPSHAPTSTFASPKGSDIGSQTGSWLKELQGRLDGSRKLLVPRIEARTSRDGEGWFISVAVHLIWKGLFILTARPMESAAFPSSSFKTASSTAGTPAFLAPGSQQAIAESNKRSPSPGQISAALRSVANVGTSRARKAEPQTAITAHASSAAASGWATPHDGTKPDGTVSPAGGTQQKLHKSAQPTKTSSAQLSDLYALQKMSLRFCKGFLTDKAMAAVAAELSRAEADEEHEEDSPDVEDEEDELARQALAEAFEAMNSTILVIQAMDTNIIGVKMVLDRCKKACVPTATAAAASLPTGQAKNRDTSVPAKSLDAAQVRAFKTIPPLLLLHISYCRLPSHVKMPSGLCSSFLPPPPALFGISWQEYEHSIAGFVGGSSWAQAALLRWQKAAEDLWSECVSLRQELNASRQDSAATVYMHLESLEHANAEEFSSTPTPARLAAQAARLAQRRLSMKNWQSSSDSLSTEASRGSSHVGGSSADTRFDSYARPEDVRNPTLRRSSCQLEDDRSEQSDSSIGEQPTSEASPRLAPAGSSASAVENLASSSESLGVRRSSFRVATNKNGTQKQRFWQPSGPAGSSGGVSQARGFHLPSLTCPGFVSRNSSPAGSLRSTFGTRSRSSRSATVIENGGAVSNGSQEPRDAVHLELAELDRTQESVAFFAKVLEWAGWCAGVELKCALCDSESDKSAP